MVDIPRPESIKRKKKIRRIVYATTVLVVITGISFGASRLRPAAPAVDGPTVFIDTVKRGPMIRQVRGSGALVPENIRWITATTSGRVEKRVLRPGAAVTPTSVILIMSNSELQQAATSAERAWKSSQSVLRNRRAQLETELLTQEAALATAQSNANQAALLLAAKEQLHKDTLISTLELRQFQGQAADTKNRERIALRQFEIAKAGVESQISPHEADVSDKRATYDLVLTQLEDLKVKAGMSGVLQLLPVEEGASVQANQQVARVADPTVFGQEETPIQLFKLMPNGEAHRTKVMLGRSSVNQIEIREGLQPGDQVIFVGHVGV